MTQYLAHLFSRPRAEHITSFGILFAISAFAASTFMIGVSPAVAVPRSVRKACKFDYKRLCPKYRIGSARMRSCMRNSVSGMSPRCYNRLVEFYGGKRKFRGKRRRRR
ncbi:MAG: hypothetical protein AAF709_00170 [Pseudomonadota bacterium]